MHLPAGMDTDLKHVQKVADVFHADALRSTWTETLLIIYGVVSVIVLLNMLIAMMGTTMSNTVQQHGTGWRQYQVCLCACVRACVWKHVCESDLCVRVYECVSMCSRSVCVCVCVCVCACFLCLCGCGSQEAVE